MERNWCSPHHTDTTQAPMSNVHERESPAPRQRLMMAGHHCVTQPASTPRGVVGQCRRSAIGPAAPDARETAKDEVQPPQRRLMRPSWLVQRRQ